jgi:hypothetical protein
MAGTRPKNVIEKDCFYFPKIDPAIFFLKKIRFLGQIRINNLS